LKYLTIILLFFSIAGFSQSVKIDGATGTVSDLATDTMPASADLIIMGNSDTSKSITFENFTLVPHGAFSFNDSSITLTMTTGAWSSITNATNTLFTSEDADLLTFAGDSVTLEHAGDYMCIISLSFSGSAADQYEVALFLNNVLTYVTIERSTSQTDVGNLSLPAYLEGIAAGDDLTLKIRNTASNDDATVISCSWLIWRLHI